MARYGAAGTVAQANIPASTTVPAAILGAGASAGGRLRRLTLGSIDGTSVPVSQQVQIGIVRMTVAPTAGGTVNTPVAFDPNALQAANCTFKTASATAFTGMTVSANLIYQVAFNTQSAVDLPWEAYEEMMFPLGAANGLAFMNLTNVWPAATNLSISVEWEE